MSLADLTAAVSQLRGCFDALSGLEQRFLLLRTGLDGNGPSSRRAVARRLGLSTSGAGRVERRALRKLRSAGASGGCAQASASATAGLTSTNVLVSPVVASVTGAGQPRSDTPLRTVAAVGPPALDPVSPRLRTFGGSGLGWGMIAPVLVVLGILAALVMMMTGASLAGVPDRRPPPGRPAEDQLFVDWEAQLADELPERETVSSPLAR